MSSLSVRSLVTLLTIAGPSLAQFLLQSGNTFVLYPYVTSSGNLTGPYTDNHFNKKDPLTTASGREVGQYTTDCFNRYVFTSYVGTHCYGQDQCGFRRWSLNATNPDPDCDTLVTGAGWIRMLITPPYEVDSLGRRNVGWSDRSSTECAPSPGNSGFSIAASEEQGIMSLRYDNPMDASDEFGTFMTCWTDGELYGPTLYYRNAAGTMPEGCADILLVPRCGEDTTSTAPVETMCYQGGLPA